MGRVLPLLIVLAVLGAAAFLFVAGDDDPAADSSLMPPEQAPVTTTKGEPSLDTGVGEAARQLAADRAAPPTEAELARRDRLALLWERALVLHGMKRDAQALSLLETYLESHKAFFEDERRAKILAQIRSGATQIIKADAAADRLKELVEELRRWGNLRPLDDPEKASALERQLRHAAGVIAKLPKEKQRALLMRHLERFLVPRGRGYRDDRELEAGAEYTVRSRMDVDALLDAVQTAEETREDPTVPLPIEEPETVEGRRMEQLEALRVRGALTLLDSLHAGLAWLALNQGEDGRFADGAALERCTLLYADDDESMAVCRSHLSVANDRYAITATALALMAFLDFRDQDGRGLFEPTISRAVAWLRKQQDNTGLFSKGGRAYYSDAIALMALSQAAGATGDEALKTSVAKGLARLYAGRGAEGGYRYGPKQAGDTSVSGWVAQAVEYATLAGIAVPEGMREGLKTFLETVRIKGERFAYTAVQTLRGQRGQFSLYAAGMLMGRILWERVPEVDHKAWSTWLTKGSGRRSPWLYSLYYGVRMDVWVHGKLTTKWHGWLIELARKQLTSGPVAGAFPNETGNWTKRSGTTLTTAFALLTMEHALFSR